MRPKKVILCVDDNEQDLSVVAYTLKISGYRALTATNGIDAIALFADNLVDLVLVDHMMPHMDGDELIRHLKKMAPHIPMVLIGDPKNMEGKVHAADAFIWKKRCSPVELLECIKDKSARKRGPRKGIMRIPLATSA